MIASGGSYYNIANGCIDSAGLPSEYQQVEYIQSNGNQYIDTNYIPNYNTKICARFSHNESVIDTPYFGVRNADRSNQYILWSHPTEFASSKTILYFNSKQQNIEKYSVNTIIYFECSNSSIIYKDQTFNWSTTSGSPSFNLYLFTLNTGGNVDYRKFSGKTWYFKIYDNNALVRNMIPCYRLSDNEIGMYDTVNGVFYTNQGTGTFVKGPNVYNRYKIENVEMPHISGHVNDNSNELTFLINGNTNVTVPIDNNGNWKWFANVNVTSLQSAFEENLVIDRIELYGFNNITSGKQAFNKCRNIKKCVFRNCDAHLLTNGSTMFQNMGANYNNELELVLPKNFAPTNCYRLFSGYRPLNRTPIPKEVFKNATDLDVCFGSAKVDVVDYSLFSNANYWYRNGFYFNGTEILTIILPKIYSTCRFNDDFFGNTNINIIFTDTIEHDIPFNRCISLSKDSIIGAINAAAANVTYTLHSTIYNKCASGGEWYTDVQAAIDAKALEGYTVTLISA